MCCLLSTPDKPAQEPLGSSCLCLPFCHSSTWIIDSLSESDFYMLLGDLNSGLHSYSSNALPLCHLSSLCKTFRNKGGGVTLALRPRNSWVMCTEREVTDIGVICGAVWRRWGALILQHGLWSQVKRGRVGLSWVWESHCWASMSPGIAVRLLYRCSWRC